MTYYNFKSIFAWNIILYTGFMAVTVVYLALNLVFVGFVPCEDVQGRPDVAFAAAESLLPGPVAMGALDACAQRELAAIFTDLTDMRPVPARPVPPGRRIARLELAF